MYIDVIALHDKPKFNTHTYLIPTGRVSLDDSFHASKHAFKLTPLYTTIEAGSHLEGMITAWKLSPRETSPDIS